MLADACNRGPSTFTRNTRRLETLKLQLRGAAGEEAANLKKALKRCRDAAYEDIKRDGYVREEDWHACVDAFKEREKRINKCHDVQSLCRAMPMRLRELKANGGDRLRY